MKERIIGAAVLVLFVVLVVPIFLDGPPKEAEIVSERVMLPGQDAQTTQTVVLDRNRTEPVPAASNAATTVPQAATPQPDQPEAEKMQEVAPILEKKPAVVEQKSERTLKITASKSPPDVKTPPAVSTTGMWAVQLGSFSKKENAEKLAADLRKQGYAAFLSQLAKDSGQLHRVRIGPQKDRASAEAMAGRLSKAGHKGQVVPHP